MRDGAALVWWARTGKRAAFLTSRQSTAVDIRAAELRIDRVVQGALDKGEAYQRLLEETGLRAGQVCAVGDDLPDLAVLGACGLPVAVADACPEVRALAAYVAQARGGHGAVREVVEMILGCQGLWPPI